MRTAHHARAGRLLGWLATPALILATLGTLALLVYTAPPVPRGPFSPLPTSPLPTTTAPPGSPDFLLARLQQRGVPVRDLRVSPTRPYSVTVTIARAGIGFTPAGSDCWNMTLGEREALFVLGAGNAIDRVEIKYVSADGQILRGNITERYLGLRLLPLMVKPSQISDETASSVLRNQIAHGSLTLRAAQVGPYDADGNEGQLAEVFLVAQSAEQAARESVASFVSLDRLLRQLNDAGASIVLGREEVTDPNGRFLAHFDADLQQNMYGGCHASDVVLPREFLKGMGSP